MTRPTVSTFMICLNEASLIEASLRSVGFCDQIVVVDSGSTDGTREIVAELIAEGLPIEWHERAWPGYAAQKQWALERCTGDWCLNLDADEVAASGFEDAMRPLLATTNANLVRVMGRFALYGVGLPPRGVAPWPLRRIHRRGTGRYDVTGTVHEHLAVEGGTVTARALELHDMRALPAHEMAAKWARYADLKARGLHARGVRPRPLKRLLNPPYAFLRDYLVRRYALAGWAGMEQASTRALYARMTEVRLTELWRVDGRPDPIAADDMPGQATRDGGAS